ncbi:hypothetical protein [Pandoraea commovens]|uniref:Uncharacterized protein n=1 Tax=Pandoraea commovens TaxID=2508289 RepID=A0ABY5QI54_9BURK|nr:hypothetical protein [Pandoraea commovens]UVA80120.1 hypothetical protein NTU39_03595 [Pandoraea commovens]
MVIVFIQKRISFDKDVGIDAFLRDVLSQVALIISMRYAARNTCPGNFKLHGRNNRRETFEGTRDHRMSKKCSIMR